MIYDFTSQELANTLANSLSQSVDYKESFVESEGDQDITLRYSTDIVAHQGIIINKNIYSSATGFVLDDPVLGILDDAGLFLDGSTTTRDIRFYVWFPYWNHLVFDSFYEQSTTASVDVINNKVVF